MGVTCYIEKELQESYRTRSWRAGGRPPARAVLLRLLGGLCWCACVLEEQGRFRLADNPLAVA